MKQSNHTTFRAGLALLGLLALLLAPRADALAAAGTPTLTTLHSFSALSNNVNVDGADPPAAPVQGSDGNFYGTTSLGGAYGNGSVYEITPSGKLTVLWSFTPLGAGTNLDGANPYGSLVQGSDGNFYGTTSLGGANGNGTVFMISGPGVLTPLYSFSAMNAQGINTDGAQPDTCLVQASDGNFYGTAAFGGTSGDGAVFKITPAGTLTLLHSFTGVADGADPEAGLVQGSDGNFYGTTATNGANDHGTVFKITPAGVLTTLHSFSSLTGGIRNSDGADPYASLAIGSDGNFYGTTYDGGAYAFGTVFKITPAGALTTLHSFTSGADGGRLLAGLVLGIDGSFYGTTLGGGGTSNDGTVFKISPSGVLTTLHSFTGADGSHSQASVVQGSDGSFYGTTYFGGDNNKGTVFKLAPAAGSTYALWNNSGQASLWKIPASGSMTSASYGPYAGWTPVALASDTSGNAYILWTTTAGSASVWKLSSSLAITTSQTFGPFSGWTAKSLAVGPDSHVHLLWNGPSNAASIYNIVLGASSTSKAYGPFSGWQAQQIAFDYNNNTHVLWTDSAASEASLWNITSAGVQTSQSLGPFAGWQAISLALAPGGQPRIVWDFPSTKQAAVFTMAPNGTYACQALGPYSGWTPSNLSVNADGDSFLMWTSTSNQLSLFDIGSTGSFASIAYGPYSGWAPIAIAPGP